MCGVIGCVRGDAGLRAADSMSRPVQCRGPDDRRRFVALDSTVAGAARPIALAAEHLVAPSDIGSLRARALFLSRTAWRRGPLRGHPRHLLRGAVLTRT